MASFSVPPPKTASPSSSSALARFGSSNSNGISSLANHSSSLAFQKPEGKQFGSWKLHAQCNEVTAKASSNCAPPLDVNPEISSLEAKDDSAEQMAVPDALAISACMNQVSNLVKLVDSRDITELHLKQLGCELIIRKKEALQQQAPAAAPPPPAMFSYPSPPAPAVAPAPAPTPAPANPSPAPTPALPAPAKSAHPPLKCPMPGTFYRSPSPGAPPFVKVGDKVQKGQVLCIIEAMKLMNEVEADRAGTIVEILAEDGKPVSMGTPLFVIAP